MKKNHLLTAVALVILSAAIYAQQAATYHIAKIFHIKSNGGYDYITVDTASSRLYVI